jgi:hypothetical protein
MNIRGILTRFVLPLCALSFAAACSGGDESSDDALTSVTARSRTLKFAGYVYVDQSASDYTILDAVKAQTQSAFGALRTANIGVNSRELGAVDPKTFVKTTVKVVDPASPTAPAKTMTKVTYTYTDAALVPVTMARRSSAQLGLLAPGYESQTARITKECTANDSEAHEFASSLWYVFDPSLSQCKTAMGAEQQKIDADRKKLADATVIPTSEVKRLYIPMTAALVAAKTSTSGTYPEYDRLYSGGVQKGKLVIGMVSGLMADWAAGQKFTTLDDPGYDMWFEGLRAIFGARAGFKLTKSEPVEDFTKLVVNGKTVSVPGGFDDIMKWELDGTGFPAGYTDYTGSRALREAAAAKILRHWMTFQVPLHVTIGGGVSKALTIELNTYFGAETDSTPHKRAIKNSDIFVYNGHSYIGYGPLDPSNFSPSDFPSSYQIFMINGCVSYNYYEKDYLPLKPGGTANLDIVTNGLESWVNGSGPAMGRFVGSLIDGKTNSYYRVLKAAQFTDQEAYTWGGDALRVVDGEVDNKYHPKTTPITLK